MSGSTAHMVHGAPAVARISLPTLADATAALAAHLSACPGSYLECHGKPDLERARLAWIEKKHHLQAMLTMAQEAERSGWRDSSGSPIVPIAWKPEPKNGPRDKAAEMRAYRARKSAGKAKANGRPRTSNSKDAQRLREYRARVKGAA